MIEAAVRALVLIFRKQKNSWWKERWVRLTIMEKMLMIYV